MAHADAQQLPKTSVCTPVGLSQNCLVVNADGSINVDTSGGGVPTAVTIAPSSSSSIAATKVGSTSAGVTSLSAKASAGNLYSWKCDAIAGSVAGYCIVYNSSSTPGTGALTAANVVDWCYFSTPAGCSGNYNPGPVANYSAGIQVLISSASTPFTYTTGTLTGAINALVQ